MKNKFNIVLSILFVMILFLGCKKENSHYQESDKDLLVQSIDNEIYLNKTILKTLSKYKRDGSYPYSWVGGYKGVSRNLFYQDCMIANANPDSSHSTYCCGISFEIYFESIMSILKDKDDLNGLKATDFEDFISKWFVQEKNGDGPGLALQAYGLGKSIKRMQDVLPGDFVQIWRSSGSGHSVIFIKWLINENSDTTGMTYWSTQPSTNGINYNDEYFDGFGGKVDKSVTHYSRAFTPQQFIIKE